MLNVKSICDSIKNIATKTGRAAAPQIPAIVMLCSLAKRPGLSTIVSVMNIVQQLKKKGIPTEPNPDGSPNAYLQIVTCVVDEVYRALREDANIQSAGYPSSINFSGTAGSVPVTGMNTNPFKLVGVIQ